MTSPNSSDNFTQTTVTGESVPNQSEPTPRCDDVTRVVTEELAAQQAAGVHRAPAPPNYEILSEIGRGGMGVVYKAKQKGLNRVVALKVVLAGGHASAGQRARFLAEAEAVAALNHVGIVGVYEYGTWDGQPYMALEYCPGGSLADKLRGTPLPPNEAGILVEHMSRAIAAAHDRGIIHRDIKPSNVLLAPDGTPKIADFGLAKMTTMSGNVTLSGAVLGTPSYMAPEQARGDTKHVGPQADVYALGAVLYECLTGRPPHKGATPAETIMMSLQREPVSVRALNPGVPVDLETICLKCLEKDPLRRYSSALALAEDLERFRTGRPVLARPVGPLGRVRRWVARNQLVSGLLAAVVVAVIAGTTTTYLKYLAEAEQRSQADIAKAEAIRQAGEKEEALQELRRTLSRLEQLTEEQRRTLIHLQEQKTASEDALLRGLLRPLRNHQTSTITLEESRVLFEVGTLTEERLRFRLIERGLTSKEGTEKLMAWPQEILGATVGLDRGAAKRLREKLAEHLKSPTSTDNSRVAGAFLITPIAKHDPEANRLALTAIVRGMLERSGQELAELPDGVPPLASRLTPEDSAAAARLLAKRLLQEADSTALVHLGSAFSHLAERVPETDAAAIARSLLDELILGKNTVNSSSLCSALAALAPRLSRTDAATLAPVLAKHIPTLPAATQSETNIVHGCVVSLAALSDRLDPEARHSLLPPVVKFVADHLETAKETQTFFNLTGCAVSLGARSDPSDRVRIARVLTARILVEDDSLVLSNTAYSLTELAPRMTSAETKPFARAVAGRLSKDFDPLLTLSLTACLANLALRLTPEEAAEVVREPAAALVARITAASPMPGVATISAGFWPIGRIVGTADAAEPTRRLIERMVVEKNPETISHLAYALLPLIGRITTEECDAHAKQLADRMVKEKETGVIGNMAAAFSGLTGRLDEPSATMYVERVVAVMVERVTAEKESAPVSSLSSTLATLSGRVSPSAAARYARSIAARMASEKDTLAVSHYSTTLAAFLSRLNKDEAANIVAPAARSAVDRLLQEQDPNSLYHAATAFTQLAPRMGSEELTESVKGLVEQLLGQRDSALHYYYGSAIASGAAGVSPDAAVKIVQRLLPRITTENDPNTLPALCSALAAFGPRLQADEAGKSAQIIVNRMVMEKDGSLLQKLGETFAAFLPQVSEEELLRLLRLNTAFPPIRVPLLSEFGLRSRRLNTPGACAVAGVAAPEVTPSPAFPNVWEFMDWAESARPNLDLGPARIAEPE